MVTLSPPLQSFFQKLRLPPEDSHKGQNGKLLIIGGSELFHAASRWSLDVASNFVDMVFYSSVPSNNELIKEAKGQFWNGIVVRRENIDEYLREADCVLIGPGMTRSEETAEVTNRLVNQYPQKKWVIDAGALQMVDSNLLNKQMILTPHPHELELVLAKHLYKNTDKTQDQLQKEIATASPTQLQAWSAELGNSLVVLKGKVDKVFSAKEFFAIEGGSPGMTKGGTGDVLAGLIAGLACTNDLLTAAVVGSVTNKRAGEKLEEKYGPFFNASLLITAIPETLWELYQRSKST